MPNRFCGWLFLLFFGIIAPAFGEWVPGIVHVHTTFSDGSDNVPQRVAKAKRLGYKFLVVTDHREQIASREKPPAKWYGQVANRGIDVGFADYLRNCREQTSAVFVTIPGAEVQVTWKAEADTTDYSHTLAIGGIGSIDNSPQPTAQPTVIAWLNGHDLLAGAAHPALIKEMSASSRPWEWQRFRYDRRTPGSYAGVRSVEFFNDDTPEQFAEVLAWYLNMVGAGSKVFVTSGCDSHGWKEFSDSERWERVTYVWLGGGLSQASLLDAMDMGRTYAAAKGTQLKSINYRPGLLYQVRQPVVISFSLWVKESSTISLYRDGKLISTAKTTKKKQDQNYRMADPGASPGTHRYVLVVGRTLVTSPILLNVKAADSKQKRTSSKSPYSGVWEKEDVNGKSMLEIGDGTFSFAYSTDYTRSMGLPKELKVTGHWKDNGRGRIQGSGEGSDGVAYDFDASFVVNGKELYYSIMTHKDKFKGFQCWVWKK